jgi:hypothetical protein
MEPLEPMTILHTQEVRASFPVCRKTPRRHEASEQYRAIRHGINGSFGNVESATCRLYNPANGLNLTLTTWHDDLISGNGKDSQSAQRPF